MRPPATIETARLRLRPAVMDDAPVIFATWTQDPEVSGYVTWPPHRSVDDTRDFLRHCVEGWEKNGPFTWGIALRENGCLVGTIELRPQGHRVELGYVHPLINQIKAAERHLAEAQSALRKIDPNSKE